MMSEEFRRGARAMFDSLLSRSANNYHGNPAINKRCMEESAIVEAWAADALAEVSPDDFTEWRSVADAYAEGQKSGAEAERQRCVRACREVERQPIRKGANAEFDMGKSVGAEKCIEAIRADPQRLQDTP